MFPPHLVLSIQIKKHKIYAFFFFFPNNSLCPWFSIKLTFQASLTIVRAQYTSTRSWAWCLPQALKTFLGRHLEMQTSLGSGEATFPV